MFLGVSLLAYGRMEEVEPWVAELYENKSNAILRQTAVCMLAMAYAGSGKAEVVRRLLAKVATDPNHDVKRFAVMAVGFVLSKWVVFLALYYSLNCSLNFDIFLCNFAQFKKILLHYQEQIISFHYLHIFCKKLFNAIRYLMSTIQRIFKK